MKKIVSRGACLLLALCFSLNAVGCQKSNEDNKIKEGQSISSEEAGRSINANDKNETFKPSDYTLETKKDINDKDKCINRGKCKNACPVYAISYGVRK